MKRLLLSIAATLALAAAAMPTREEQKAAASIVGELMNPLVADFRAKKKTAVEVGDAAMAYAKEANTEAAKFLLLKGAIWYFAQAKEDAKAVAAIAALGEQVKDLPPEVMRNDVLKPAIDHVSEQNVPGLFAQFRSASAQMEIVKLGPSVRRNRADEPTRRRYAELLVVTGDWKTALEVFAKLEDAKAAKAAKDEIGCKTLAPAGDFWWDYSPTEDTAAEPIKAHAVALYRKAIASGELTGLKKVVAEKRIASVPFADRFNVSDADNVSQGSATPAASGKQSNALYCVIDPSAGPTASKYPVKWLDTPPPGGFNVDEYKTTKLVLRRIEPGKFMMSGKFNVTLTKPFYIGVFEMTQKQYELVTCSNPSKFKGDMRPVEQISWNKLRGDSATYNWPSSVNVDSSTFIGKIQARTGLNFDLPTEAQWEYACRAGTRSEYNNGGDSETDMKKLGRFVFNQKLRGYEEADQSVAQHEPDGKGGCLEAHTVVGSYLPNNWGLYDMHGNVYEWCLDWHGNLSNGVTDPSGASSGLTCRVFRGGSWVGRAHGCTSSKRFSSLPRIMSYSFGFRLCMNPEGPVGASARGSGTPAASGEQPEPLVLDLGGGVKMEMVGCPAGKFIMEHGKGQGLPNDGRRSVIITRPFWFGKYPVTVAEWERLMSPASPPPGVKRKDLDPRVPVQRFVASENGVPAKGWRRVEAEDFMARLTKKFQHQLPAGYVFRLPTRAEWEYAFRANSSDPQDPFAGNMPVEQRAKYFVRVEDCKSYWQPRGCEPSQFSQKEGFAPYPPVGSLKPNAWGIYDLGGTAIEIVLSATRRLDYQAGAAGIKSYFKELWSRNKEYWSDNVRDPLLWEYDGAMAVDMISTSGMYLPMNKPWHQQGAASYGIRYDNMLKYPVTKLRLVVAPDLLKERGLKQPKLGK